MLEGLTVGDLVNLIQAVAVIGGGFYFTGRVTSTLEQLRELVHDHEDRIRSLEVLQDYRPRANG